MFLLEPLDAMGRKVFQKGCKHVQAQKSARFARLFFFIGPRQAKVVDGIHGNNCIRLGIVSEGRRFCPRLVAAIEEV